MGDLAEEKYETKGYDTSIVYDYKEYPDARLSRPKLQKTLKIKENTY